MEVNLVIKNLKFFLILCLTLVAFSCHGQSRENSYLLFKTADQKEGIIETGAYSDKLLIDNKIVFVFGHMSLGITDKFIVMNKCNLPIKISENNLREFDLIEVKDLYKIHKSKIGDEIKKHKASLSNDFVSIDTLNLIEIKSKEDIILHRVIWQANVSQME